MAQVATGTYVGSTPATQDIIVGFRPKIIIAIRDGADGPFAGEDIAAISGFYHYLQDGFYLGSPDGYTILATGFRVGSDAGINAAGITYHYIALGGDVCEVGGYAGDGTDGRLISTPGVTPSAVWVWARNVDGTRPLIRRSTNTGANQERRLSNGAPAPGTLSTLESNGFRVDNNAWSNALGTDYLWIAFRTFTVGRVLVQYAGDGNDNRNIDVQQLSVQAEVIIVEDGVGGNAYSFIRSETMASDQAQTIIPGLAFQSNFIQDEGVRFVQIGNAALDGVNPRHVNTVGRTYSLQAFGQPIPSGGKMKRLRH